MGRMGRICPSCPIRPTLFPFAPSPAIIAAFPLSHPHGALPMATAQAEKPRTVKPPRVKDQPLFIGGKRQDSAAGKPFATRNPATGEEICQVAEGDKADIDLAVAAARKAFEDGPWPRMAASERGRLLNKLADAVEKNK